MPFFIVAGVAYAAYVNNESTIAVDPSINLDGKVSVELLPFERDLAFFEMPITTITYFRGSYLQASSYLIQRIEKIVEKNPWLGGWLIPDPKDRKKPRIYYDPEGKDFSAGRFKTLHPEEILHDKVMNNETSDNPLSSPLDDNNQYNASTFVLSDSGAYQRLLENGFVVPSNNDLLGKNQSLWKVSVVPDEDQPNDKFALVVSLSHVGGDASTFYELYNMLNNYSPIICMNPLRKLRFVDQLINAIGPKETFYPTTAMQKPLFRWRKRLDTEIIETKRFMISNDWLKKQRLSCQNSSDGVSLEPEIEPSDNSVLTSWFFNLVQADVGFMVCNFRNKWNHYPIDGWDAGNYFHPIALTPSSFATANQIQIFIESLKKETVYQWNELPAVKPKTKISFCSNWSSFPKADMNFGEGESAEGLHVPMMDDRFLQCSPKTLTMLNVFIASSSKDRDGDRRLGALVVVPKSIWNDNILPSGVIDELII